MAAVQTAPHRSARFRFGGGGGLESTREFLTRRRLTAGLAAVALAVAVGCGGEGETAGGPVTLTWFAAIQPGGAYEKIVKRCNQQSGGRYEIVIEALPSDANQQREQLVRRLGAEDDQIDIMAMDVIWTAEFANAGWLVEWTGQRAQEVTENVFDSVVETASFEDKVFGAPLNSNTQLLWYRKDRVQQVPQTWDEVIRTAEQIGEKGTIQVQGTRSESLTVWVNSMVESAGGAILTGPEEVGLNPEPTSTALATMGRLADSSAASSDIDTADEDSNRLSFQAGDASFMVNYPFVYPSAKAEAPDVFKQMGFAKWPRVVEDMPSAPPLGGFNLGVSAFSQNPDLALEAATCLRQPPHQIIVAESSGLPPVREDIYDQQEIKKIYPGFSDLIKTSIDDSAPRPLTPAYTDLSLAIQRTVHPVGEIDPQDPTPTVEALREAVEDAVQREGLL